MTDNDQDEVNRGKQAEEVLNNPVYQEAFLIIRARLMQEFEKTKFGQSDERDEVWRKMQTVGWIEKHLNQVVTSGRISEQSILARATEHLKGL